MAVSHTFRTTEKDYGSRLDQVLAAHIDSLSRTKARAVLAIGGVFVEGKRTKVAGRLMKADLEITVHLGQALENSRDGGDEALDPLPAFAFEDDELLVVEKASGLFSAPTPESDQNNLLALLQRELGKKLHLVHRLDRPTSGLMVFAKTPAAAGALGSQFQTHSIHRFYLAVLVGGVPESEFECELPIEQRPARTRFITLEQKAAAALVRAELFTGRTHQVRLHAEALGHPVAGDSKYGRPQGRALSPRPPRLALHAEKLGFTHPDGRSLEFHSPLPDELATYWDLLT